MAVDSGQSDDFKSDINVTPLVDVMLVLLIIFMLITPLLQPGLAVDLPGAWNVATLSDDPAHALDVTIRESGLVYVDRVQVEMGALTRLLSLEHDARPDAVLHLKADRNVRYGVVRRVARAGRDAGFESAALVTVEAEDPAELDGEERP
jgi:biopolymer transport protein TolR